MARKQKDAAPAVDEKQGSLSLFDEAMAEMTAKDARIFELEKIASQFGSLEDLKNLLWEARTIRLILDPDEGESAHAALTRRLHLPEGQDEFFVRRALQHASVELDAGKLLGEAQAEIERLSALVKDEGEPPSAEEYDVLKDQALDRIEDDLDPIVADTLEDVFTSHDCPLHEVWGKLSPFERRRIVHAVQKKIVEEFDARKGSDE